MNHLRQNAGLPAGLFEPRSSHQELGRFRHDPESKKVAAVSEANGKLVEKVDSVFLEPTDFSKLQ
jgi:hypothetical protein